MDNIEQYVDNLIANNKIVVFSKSYCPYCKSTKELFKQLGEDIVVIELDQIKQGADIQDYLLKKTGQRTVPNVFVRQQHIGGNSEVQAANNNGSLKKLLA
ncbi:glutaredoxin-1 [Absidia repens]|uniref:Glutaredoxin-1 n=1 Tax=Absidia repens TaxID=90262 RepID=A0A1X2IUP0_9FUNG|nr:glutaredoxin-1 [Absidia repens]